MGRHGIDRRDALKVVIGFSGGLVFFGCGSSSGSSGGAFPSPSGAGTPAPGPTYQSLEAALQASPDIQVTNHASRNFLDTAGNPVTGTYITQVQDKRAGGETLEAVEISVNSTDIGSSVDGQPYQAGLVTFRGFALNTTNLASFTVTV